MPGVAGLRNVNMTMVRVQGLLRVSLLVIMPVLLWPTMGYVSVAATGRQPEDFQNLLNQSLNHFTAGRYEDCLETAQKALALKAGDARAHTNKGVALIKLGRYDEAIEALSEAERLDPQSVLIRNNQTWARDLRARSGVPWQSFAAALCWVLACWLTARQSSRGGGGLLRPPVQLILSISLLVSLASALLAYPFLGAQDTDGYSERQVIEEGRLIAKGMHSYGIVKYTHYPNGPVYLAAAAIRAGAPTVWSLRLIPFAVSVASIALLAFALLSKTRCAWQRVWLATAVVWIAQLPAVRCWQGALHEHSLATSLLELTVAASLSLHGSREVLFVLGFVAGWIGYDLLPAIGIAAVTTRYVYHLVVSSTPAANRSVTTSTVLDGIAMASGMIIAVLTHFVQVWCFLGTLEQATSELLGSAAARMSITSTAAAELNPSYVSMLNGALGGRDVPNRFVNIRQLAGLFFSDAWAGALPVAVYSMALVATMLWVWEAATPAHRSRITWCCLAVISGSMIACVSWMLLMPYHAVFHHHFLPRHFLAGLLIPLTLPAIACPLEPALSRLPTPEDSGTNQQPSVST